MGSLLNMNSDERKGWAEEIANNLFRKHPPPTRFIVLAGEVYRRHLIGLLESAGYLVEIPMEDLGIGKQLHWLMHSGVQD